MEYKNEIKKLEQNKYAEAVRSVSRIYEALRQENFLKWINQYPDYWTTLCNTSKEDILPEYAEAVMQTLIDSNIIELQMVWLYKCGDVLDIFGKAIEQL